MLDIDAEQLTLERGSERCRRCAPETQKAPIVGAVVWCPSRRFDVASERSRPRQERGQDAHYVDGRRRRRAARCVARLRGLRARWPLGTCELQASMTIPPIPSGAGASRYTAHNTFEHEDIMSEFEGSQPIPSDTDHVDHVREQWAVTRPELDTAPAAVIARLGRASAYADASVNARLGDFGLTRESFDVLTSLRRGGAPFRLSPTQLYRELMRSSGAVTHRLASLERAGLVKRVPDPGDGRGLLVELTRKGRALVDRIAPLHLENERRLLAPLSAHEQQTLAGLLRKLLQTFEHEQPTPPPSGRGGRRKSRAHPSRRR